MIELNIEKLKNMDHRYNFVNRMGPARIRSIVYENNLYVVSIWCNIFGHGSVSKTIYFDDQLNRVK